MGYYIRVLAEKADFLSLSQLEAALRREVRGVRIQIEGGTPERWEQLVLAHDDGTEIALIERNPVLKGELGAEELQEFIDEVAHEKPASAARWLQKYLPRVKVIYAFQLLSGADKEPGWAAVWAVEGHVWSSLGGIFQADGEGFSNREGFHILWQFSDHVKGPWKMAVLNWRGKWQRFQMELSDEEQRKAFLEGRVPPGCKRL